MTRHIVAYSGTHGTGKTTAVYNRIGELKKAHPGLLIGPHVENLTFCPYPINRASSEESQLWVFTNHIQAELFLLAHYDIVVSDRTAVDAIAYTMAHGWNGLAMDMTAMARHHMRHYSEIIIKTTDNNHQHADGLRDVDPVFRGKVEDCLLAAYGILGYFLSTDSHGIVKAVRPGQPGLTSAGTNP